MTTIASRAAVIRRVHLLRVQYAARMAADLRKFFEAQSRRAVSRLVNNKSTKIMPLAESLITPDEDLLLRNAIQSYLNAGLINFSELAALLLAQQLPLEPNQVLRDLIARSGTRITRINATTRNAVRDLLQQAEMRGYNTYQTANGVPADGYRGIRSAVRETYRNRAEAIARTEMAEVSQRAAHEQWRELGVEYVDIIDGDKDEPCASRNNTRVSIEEDVGPKHPNCTVMSIPVPV